jgi:hypothetical protein
MMMMTMMMMMKSSLQVNGNRQTGNNNEAHKMITWGIRLPHHGLIIMEK